MPCVYDLAHKLARLQVLLSFCNLTLRLVVLLLQASYQGSDDGKAMENLKLLLSMGIEVRVSSKAQSCTLLQAAL